MISALAAKNIDTPLVRFQSVDQIASALLRAIKESEPAARYLAPKFRAASRPQSLKLIYVFTKSLIPYKREPGHYQTAKTLPRIIQDANLKGGDCKHYSTTIAALCKALDIPVTLRLISQSAYSTNPTHIYCVSKLNGREYVIDPCMKNFDQEAKYYFKKDIPV